MSARRGADEGVQVARFEDVGAGSDAAVVAAFEQPTDADRHGAGDMSTATWDELVDPVARPAAPVALVDGSVPARPDAPVARLDLGAGPPQATAAGPAQWDGVVGGAGAPRSRSDAPAARWDGSVDDAPDGNAPDVSASDRRGGRAGGPRKAVERNPARREAARRGSSVAGADPDGAGGDGAEGPSAGGRDADGRQVDAVSTGRRGRERSGRMRGFGPAQIDPDADPVAAARDICLRLLTDRSRTRHELAQALSRRGVPDDAAASVLERFDEVGLIDDAAFAGQWVRSRHSYRGLARRAIAMELRRKGVDDEVAGEALGEVDDRSEARRARELVDRRLRSLAVATAEQRTVAARRLVGMLARKGYGPAIAYGTVREALAVHGADADELGPEATDD